MDLSNAPSEVSAPNPWSRRRRLTLGLTALALIAGGGVAIAAAQPDTDTTDQPDSTTSAVKPAPGKAAFGLGGVLHSESVVSDGDGGYVTHLHQVGKVESLDADRLTVVSEDGYERSWNRTSDTAVGGAGWSVEKNGDGSFTVKKDTDELAVGDTVIVVGTLKDDVATAQRIASRPDSGEIPGIILKRFGDEFGGRAGGAFSAPVPKGMPGEMSKDHLRERFERKMPGEMGGPGGDVRRFEFRTPDGDAKLKMVPAPEAAPEAVEEPSAGAVPAEPSASITESGYASLT